MTASISLPWGGLDAEVYGFWCHGPLLPSHVPLLVHLPENTPPHMILALMGMSKQVVHRSCMLQPVLLEKGHQCGAGSCESRCVWEGLREGEGFTVRWEHTQMDDWKERHEGKPLGGQKEASGPCLPKSGTGTARCHTVILLACLKTHRSLNILTNGKDQSKWSREIFCWPSFCAMK